MHCQECACPLHQVALNNCGLQTKIPSDQVIVFIVTYTLRQLILKTISPYDYNNYDTFTVVLYKKVNYMLPITNLRLLIPFISAILSKLVK